MASFPTSPVPDAPYATTDTYKTLASPEYDSGVTIFKSLRNYPLFGATLVYGEHTLWSDVSGASGLYDFFVSMKGMAGSFTFIDFNGHDSTPVGIRWPKLYVAVATSRLTYNLPMVGSSSYTLWKNGADQTSNLWASGGFSGNMWKFHAAAGTDGVDTIEFASTQAGTLLEWQATGQRVVRNAHFTTDVMSISAFSNMLCSTGLAIKESR